MLSQHKYSAALLLAAVIAGPAWAGPAPLSTPLSVKVLSADGTTVTPPSSSSAASAPAEIALGLGLSAAAAKGIYTEEGPWTFGTPANASGDYPILLNGSKANGGFADLLQVTNGRLYARQKNGTYWVRWNAAWFAGTGAPVEGAGATALSLTVTLPKVPDNARAGTVVATAKVTMLPAGAAFTGPLVSSNPLFAARGTNIVLTRALSSTDDAATVHSTITAVQ